MLSTNKQDLDKLAYLHGLKEEIQRDDFTIIQTWEDYSKESHNDNAIHQQFHNLLMLSCAPITKQKPIQSCPHHHFKDEQTFLRLIFDYILNKPKAVQELNTHDRAVQQAQSGTSIKSGICIQCIHKFAINTNGLNDIYIRLQQNTQYLTRSLKRFRFEFMNANLILVNQPLFVKVMLSKSNLLCIGNIFKLFFISYLKDTNLHSLILDNHTNISDPLRVWTLPNSSHKYDFVIKDNTLNICHGMEHSLCTLSSTIIYILPLLKPYHIKYLFLDDEELQNVVHIINDFLNKYCALPHIESVHRKSNNFVWDEAEKIKFLKWRKRIQTDEAFKKAWPYKGEDGQPLFFAKNDALAVDEVYDRMIMSKHPLLKRMMFIISSLYQHFNSGRLRLKRKMRNNEIDREEMEMYRKLKQQKEIFDGFLYKHKSGKTYILNTAKGWDLSANVWNLMYCYMQVQTDNKSLRKEHGGFSQCGGCNIQQRDFPKRKLKICSGCELSFYCSKKCQKYDWSRNKHRDVCTLLRASLRCV